MFRYDPPRQGRREFLKYAGFAIAAVPLMRAALNTITAPDSSEPRGGSPMSRSAAERTSNSA